MPPTSPFVLIDDARPAHGGEAPGAWLFDDPSRIIRCDQPGDVSACLADIDAATAQGRFVAGFMAYELGYALEAKLAPLIPEDRTTPLLWMGVFDAPKRLDQAGVRALMETWATAPAEVALHEAALTREDYLANVARIREHIAAGDVYQINYTFLQPFTLDGSPLSLYARLRNRQRAGYGAVIDTGERHILSLSPELFVETHDGDIRTRPMKGTAARRANPADDAQTTRWLHTDEKSRAENLMIVDLLRNDLSRIADVGSVKVRDLFHVETYPTVHQMTSTVEGRIAEDVSFSAIAQALFPCGSVTGAPKVKAMEIIRTLEDGARGVYTGAVGFVGPGQARFNVAIRTLDITPDKRGQMGIGSGVVYDSVAEDEWDECHLKARFLTRNEAPFDLLETLKWTPQDGFALLERHVRRLETTAAYFGFDFDLSTVMAALNASVANATQAKRLRLTVDPWGAAQVATAPLPVRDEIRPWRYAIASTPVDDENPFVYFKTTNRAFYDDARESLQAETGCDEVVFLNGRGELTEGSITNLFIEKDGVLLTPPVSSGLLAGTLRAELLDTGRARESVLTQQDLHGADQVYLGNSVRGLMPAQPFDE